MGWVLGVSADKEERSGLNLSSLSRAEKTRSTSSLSAEPATVAAPLFLSSSSKALNSSAHMSTPGSGEETREGRQTRRSRTFVDLAVVFKVDFLKEGDHLFYLLHALNFYAPCIKLPGVEDNE